MKTGLIDYGGGNLRSVANALHALGVEPLIVSEVHHFNEVSQLILPGQGEFADVMRQLGRRGLVDELREWIAADRPYLGICVGYQILFQGSDEATGVDGLGVIKGRCVRFAEEAGKKIPQMGWNAARPDLVESGYWRGLGEEPYFYFVHSFFPIPEDEAWTISRTEYCGEVFAASVERGNVLACQFHPEKSQDAGLRLMRNFLERTGDGFVK